MSNSGLEMGFQKHCVLDVIENSFWELEFLSTATFWPQIKSLFKKHCKANLLVKQECTG